jgi:lipoprotein NlpD
MAAAAARRRERRQARLLHRAPGDTLIRIALDTGQNWRDIVRWNNIDNPNVIEVGQVLRVAPPNVTPWRRRYRRPRRIIVFRPSAHAGVTPASGAACRRRAAAQPPPVPPRRLPRLRRRASPRTGTPPVRRRRSRLHLARRAAPVLAGFDEPRTRAWT